MGAMMVVPMQPFGQESRTVGAASVSNQVCPLVERRANKALGLTVRAWPVRSREDMADPQCFHCIRKELGAIRRSIVRHHPLYDNTLSCEPSDGAMSKAGRRLLRLIRQDLRVTHPRVIINAQMHHFPTKTLFALPASVASNP